MKMCAKCMKMCGAITLAVGIGFLLRDFGMWNFWGISWYSAAFILLALGKCGAASCKMCKKA